LAGARFHPKMQPSSSDTTDDITSALQRLADTRGGPPDIHQGSCLGPRADTYPRSTALLKDIQEIEQKAQAALTTRKPRLNGAF